MSASEAISGYSTTLQYGDGSSPEEFTPIAEVSRIGSIGIQREALEATHLASPDEWKEFFYAMLMSGALTADVNFLPVDDTQGQLISDATDTSSNAYKTWRLVLPDFGAVTKTATVSGSTWSSSSHGYLTGQSIRLTTTDTLPAGFDGGRKVYWLNRADANSFSLHTTPEDAAAGSNAVSASDSGTGTHMANGTTTWTFRAACSGFVVGDIDAAARLSGTVQFSTTGATTVAP